MKGAKCFETLRRVARHRRPEQCVGPVFGERCERETPTEAYRVRGALDVPIAHCMLGDEMKHRSIVPHVVLAYRLPSHNVVMDERDVACSFAQPLSYLIERTLGDEPTRTRSPNGRLYRALAHDCQLCPVLDIESFISQYLWFVKASRADDVWDAMGDRTRRAIIERLANGPLAVVDLANELPVSQPAVSQHLKVLKAAGLVTERAAGTRRIYRLNPIGVAALRDQLDTFWNRALDGYKDIVERSTEETS
jgi:DNA-binding transcriptional ArsR family regulator